MDYQDYYKSLGVERNATLDQIRKAYRRLARKYHPDVSKDPAAESRFKEINEAYDVLKDPKKREAYDMLGANWRAGQNFDIPPEWTSQFNLGGANGTGFKDLYSMLDGIFSHGGSGFRTSQPHGFQHDLFQQPAQRVTLRVSLEDLYLERPVEVSIAQRSRRGPSSTPRRLKIKIPRGLFQGDKFRLAGQGENGTDLIAYLDVLPHAKFKQDGKDILSTLKISPWQAALGAIVETETLGGKVQLKVPAGTSSGKKVRLRGRGIQDGHHYVTLEIALPETISAAERQLYEELRELSEE